jgi:glutamate synthase (NADPH/NADH) large chain
LAKPRASAEPDVEQIFVARPHHITNADDFERKLYILRRYITKTVTEQFPKAAEQFLFYVVFMQKQLFIKAS